MRPNQTILGGAGPSACAAAPAAPSLPRERIVYTTKTVHEIGVGPGILPSPRYVDDLRAPRDASRWGSFDAISHRFPAPLE